MRCLNIIYDLQNEPVNFGITPSLVIADLYREQAGFDFCRMFVVMAPGDGFRHASIRDKEVSVEEKKWRLQHMVVAAARLLPSCRAVAVIDDRRMFADLLPSLTPDIFPQNYSMEEKSYRKGRIGKHGATIKNAINGFDIQRLQAPSFALESARQWLANKSEGKPSVSLTIRDCNFQSGRNSRLDNWIRLADHIVGSGCVPIFVPDTETLMAGEVDIPERFVVNGLAPLNMEIRTAIYEACDLNFFVGNGPCMLAQYNKRINYVLCNLIVPGQATTSPEHFAHIGLPVGSQIPGRQNDYGEIVWEPDDADVLIRAFEQWRTKTGKA